MLEDKEKETNDQEDNRMKSEEEEKMEFDKEWPDKK